MAANDKNKTTILRLRRQKKKNIKTVITTAYDYPQAMIADGADVDCILVGDSLGMTTLGYKTTIPVTMDQMVSSCEAVSRGAKKAFLIGDMPYMSYQVSNEEAVHNAGRFIRAGMDCVKVEGAMVERIKAIVDSGIMVMSHDLMGLFWEFKSKFVKRYCEAGQIMQNALKKYAAEVREGVFPAEENFYAIKEEELEKLLGGGNWKQEKIIYETDQGFPTNHSATPNTTTTVENTADTQKAPIFDGNL